MGASLKKDEKKERAELVDAAERERERVQKEFEEERAELVKAAERERERAQKEFEIQKAAERVKYEEILSAVERGEGSAKTKLAWYKLSGMGGAKVDVDGAVKLLEERVKGKDGEAMWMLGMCKEYGRGIERDIEGAEKLYKESKEAGNEIGEILVKKGELWYGRGSGKMGIESL